MKRKAGHPVVAIRCCHPQDGWCRRWRSQRATIACGVWWSSDTGGGQAADIKRGVGSHEGGTKKEELTETYYCDSDY